VVSRLKPDATYDGTAFVVSRLKPDATYDRTTFVVPDGAGRGNHIRSVRLLAGPAKELNEDS